MGTLEIFSQKKQKTQLHVSETALQSSRFALIKKKKSSRFAFVPFFEIWDDILRTVLWGVANFAQKNFRSFVSVISRQYTKLISDRGKN